MKSALTLAPRRGLVAVIRFYQIARTNHPSPCRFVPSCSQYAIDAVTARGVVVGTAFAAARIFRCNPLGGHGFDPAPAQQ